MIFVYDIIPDLQVIEAVDCRSLILFRLSSLLFHAAEYIAFGQHDKTKVWIFKPLPQIPFGNHNFAGQQFMLLFPAVKRHDIIILKIAAKPLSPRLRAGQNQNTVSVFLQPLYVLREKRKVIIIGRCGLHLKIKLPLHLPILYRHIEGRQK